MPIPPEPAVSEEPSAAFGGDWSPSRERDLLAATGAKQASLEDWLRDAFFEQHCKLFHNRPFIWHLWDGRKDGFHALVNYRRLDHAMLQKLTYSYLGDWIRQQDADTRADKPGAAERLGAARVLETEPVNILEGEPPYDIFIRWKPLKEQPLGWQPDLNDGVRLNVRPFMLDKDVGKKGAHPPRQAQHQVGQGSRQRATPRKVRLPLVLARDRTAHRLPRRPRVHRPPLEQRPPHSRPQARCQARRPLTMPGRYAAGGLEAECEPGSRGRGLRNKLGIIRLREMQRAESEALLAAQEWALARFSAEHRFTAADIRALHRHWLGDIYAWAGEYRSVNLAKGELMFAAAAQVPRLMEQFERTELARHTPCIGMESDRLTRALARTHGELVIIHPFRDGNGRCARLLALLMALQGGLPPLDFTPLAGKGRREYFASIQAAFGGDYGPLTACFRAVIRRTQRSWAARDV
jgi:cell filamentation protein, protein adenylyltransferase